MSVGVSEEKESWSVVRESEAQICGRALADRSRVKRGLSWSAMPDVVVRRGLSLPVSWHLTESGDSQTGRNGVNSGDGTGET